MALVVSPVVVVLGRMSGSRASLPVAPVRPGFWFTPSRVGHVQLGGRGGIIGNDCGVGHGDGGGVAGGRPWQPSSAEG